MSSYRAAYILKKTKNNIVKMKIKIQTVVIEKKNELDM